MKIISGSWWWWNGCGVIGNSGTADDALLFAHRRWFEFNFFYSFCVCAWGGIYPAGFSCTDIFLYYMRIIVGAICVFDRLIYIGEFRNLYIFLFWGRPRSPNVCRVVIFLDFYFFFIVCVWICPCIEEKEKKWEKSSIASRAASECNAIDNSMIRDGPLGAVFFTHLCLYSHSYFDY
jgi:hypothetical protein